MKTLKAVALGACLLTLSQVDARSPYSKNSSSSSSSSLEQCIFAEQSFSTTTPDNWYEISTLGYPATVPLSKFGNNGVKKGEIKLTPTGVTILEDGDYLVSFSTIMLNLAQESTPLIPVFLVQNGVFNPSAKAGAVVGGTAQFPPEYFNTISGTGILQNVKKGTKLSLVATNGGGQEPQLMTVITWNIVVTKLPCKS